MNDTQQFPPPGGQPSAGPDDDFDPQKLRTIADMQRSQDDRVVAGVCAGAARYLNVDPVVVRVLIAVLTIAGFAGAILYIAAWLLLPAEGEDRSLVAEWFKIDDNEEQVRQIGLVSAGALAVLSLVGNSSWAWWGDAPWWILPFALLFYLFWLRPQRRREARTPVPDPYDQTTYDPAVAGSVRQKKPAKQREPRSPVLFLLTMSLTAIALAVVWIVDETRSDLHWTAYVATALAVVAIGLLVGTVVGDAGGLIAIGILLAISLAIGSVFPSGRIGEQRLAPTVAADVETSYRHGIGELELDLTRVGDPDFLAGRTIFLDAGIGETRVIVPDGLNVRINAHVRAGEITLFGRRDEGIGVSMADAPDQPAQPAVTIDIEHDLGPIEVIRR